MEDAQTMTDQDVDRGEKEANAAKTPAPGGGSTTNATKKKRNTKAAGKDGLRVPPFQVSRFSETRRQYGWIDEYPGKRPPRQGDILEKYGPGRYQLEDAAGSRARWTIHGVHEIPGEDVEEHEDTAPAFDPRPYRHEPPPDDYGYGYRGGGMDRRGPAHPPAPAGVDPYTSQTLYRLDASVTQIHQDGRRLADELRSLRYDIELAPSRIAERVAQVIADARDPIDEMVRLHQVSQTMGFGDGGGGGDSGIGSVISSALSGLAQAQGAAAAPAPAPPAPALHSVPPAPASNPATPPAPPELAGMTPAIKGEISAIAASLGMDPTQAIAIGKAQGWSAPKLLEYARALAHRKAAEK